jgi:peptidoglycan-N-acetylglucosamine deacetylase
VVTRIWILEELIRRIKSTGRVWFATHAEIAAWAKQHAT